MGLYECGNCQLASVFSYIQQKKPLFIFNFRNGMPN